MRDMHYRTYGTFLSHNNHIFFHKKSVLNLKRWNFWCCMKSLDLGKKSCLRHWFLQIVVDLLRLIDRNWNQPLVDQGSPPLKLKQFWQLCAELKNIFIMFTCCFKDECERISRCIWLEESYAGRGRIPPWIRQWNQRTRMPGPVADIWGVTMAYIGI